MEFLEDGWTEEQLFKKKSARGRIYAIYALQSLLTGSDPSRYYHGQNEEEIKNIIKVAWKFSDKMMVEDDKRCCGKHKKCECTDDNCSKTRDKETEESEKRPPVIENEEKSED